MHPSPVLSLGLITLLLGAPVPVGAHTTAQEATPAVAGGDFAGLVKIGSGRRLWLECRGAGSPTVILEAGAGHSSEVWDTVALPPELGQLAVLLGVAAFTRVCAYDRPGTMLDSDHSGRSDPVPMPRNAADAVADLHALLSAAEVPGPYVLVGQSLGGVIVRLYAATYPDEVSGLVLVDSAHEEQNARLEAALGAENWAAYEGLQQQVPPELERMDLDASFAQLRAAVATQPLPPLPLAVLSHGVPLGGELPPEAQAALPPDFPWAEMERVWQELQADLARLAPGARHTIATESGHYIQLQQPELVNDAIRQVVEAVRNQTSWANSVATPTV